MEWTLFPVEMTNLHVTCLRHHSVPVSHFGFACSPFADEEWKHKLKVFWHGVKWENGSSWQCWCLLRSGVKNENRFVQHW